MNALPLTDPADDRAPGWESADGPGRRLRETRQARGMELARVAHQLHLSPTLIAALEQDDYDALPGPVFVTGYLRNYARLLGIDPEPLLAGYRQRVPQPEPPTPKVVRASARPARSGHLAVRLVSLAVILALLGLSYAWWQDYRPPLYPESAQEESFSGEVELAAAPDSPAAGPLAGADRAADPAPAVIVDPRLARRGPETPPAPSTIASVEEDPPTVATTPAPPTPPPLVSAGPAGPVAPAEPAPGAVAAAPAQPLEPLGAPETEAAAAESSAANEGGSEGVVMAFSGPCWVDIRDSERRFKLFGEMKDGDRHVLAGTPPYSVIIGNAAAVRITVNGEPFGLEGIARGNVARFTLDPARLP